VGLRARPAPQTRNDDTSSIGQKSAKWGFPVHCCAVVGWLALPIFSPTTTARNRNDAARGPLSHLPHGFRCDKVRRPPRRRMRPGGAASFRSVGRRRLRGLRGCGGGQGGSGGRLSRGGENFGAYYGGLTRRDAFVAPPPLGGPPHALSLTAAAILLLLRTLQEAGEKLRGVPPRATEVTPGLRLRAQRAGGGGSERGAGNAVSPPDREWPPFFAVAPLFPVGAPRSPPSTHLSA
jgi:hypothetical protein